MRRGVMIWKNVVMSSGEEKGKNSAKTKSLNKNLLE